MVLVCLKKLKPGPPQTATRQVFCYPRRIRVKEFFNDFDPLRPQLKMSSCQGEVGRLLREHSGRVGSLPEFNGRVVRFPNKSQWMKNSKIKSPYWVEWGFILDRFGRWSWLQDSQPETPTKPSWRHGGGMAVVLSSTLRGHWTRSLGWIFWWVGMVTPSWEVKKSY